MLATFSQAQELFFKDTILSYNYRRIWRNKTGAEVLGAWGIANMAVGTIGFLNAGHDEWKYFHGMNAVWGLTDVCAALSGLNRAHRERHITPTFDKAYDRYKMDKRHYLASTIVDIAVISGGVVLVKYADKGVENPELYNGFGKSLVIQGVALLIFDNVMYASHMKDSNKWRRLINEIYISEHGIGFNHSF
jgi:hypothetical protein